MPSMGGASSPYCKIKRSWEKTKEEVITNDEIDEVYNENFKKCAEIKKTVKAGSWKTWVASQTLRQSLSWGKTLAWALCFLRIQKALELEEEVVRMYEVDCLLEEVSPRSPLTSSKGRFYLKAGTIIRVPPESSLPPQPLTAGSERNIPWLSRRDWSSREPLINQWNVTVRDQKPRYLAK